MKMALAGAGASLLDAPGCGPGDRQEAAHGPNVVLILTDDQGSVDVNCYGAEDLHTPNLDRLASRGVRFDQFYVGAPVCSPSRAALLTGRYPQRAQLATNAYGSRGLPAEQVTMAETLRRAGYRTALFGKWHLGEALALSPKAQGFDEFLGHKGGCIDNYSHYFFWQGPNRHDLWKNDEEHFEDGVYFPDIVIREALRFIEENRDSPFFLYLPFNTPHYPLQPEPRFVGLYDHIQDPRRKRYAAFVSSLDDKIGRIVARLDELGLRANTLILFLSDHGHSEEERAFGGGGSAGPYRGHKFTLWEGGIRVPCIASWPGVVPEGRSRGQLCASIDLYPTVLEYCGLPAPSHRIDGRSIKDVIAGAQTLSPHDVMHWMFGKKWAVRAGRWKLVREKDVSEVDTLFLSDMDADVTETKNLRAEHPDEVARLVGLHEEWVKEVGRQ